MVDIKEHFLNPIVFFSEEEKFNPLEFEYEDEVNTTLVSESVIDLPNLLVENESKEKNYGKANAQVHSEVTCMDINNPIYNLTPSTQMNKNTYNNHNEHSGNNIIDTLMKIGLANKSYNFPSDEVKGGKQLFNKNEKALINFSIFVEMISVNCEDSNKTETYYITCSAENGATKSIMLSSTELNSSSWITSKLGASFVFTGNYNKDFKPLFEQLLNNAKKQYVYDTTGWHRLDGDIYRYYHGSGTIPEIQSDLVSAKGSDKFKFYCNDIKLSPAESIRYFLSMKDVVFNEKYQVSLPLLLFAILAVLKEFFILAGHEPEFCLFLIGKTGSGKTTIAELISCIFNRNNMKIHCNFNDTIASIEVVANLLKDSIMIMDDFYPTSGSEKESQKYKLERINRMYGDGKGKSRTNISLKEIKELNGNGMCLISGEQESDNLSTQVRYLGINVDNDTVNFDMLTPYQNSRLSYCDFFYWFITWISNNVDYIVNLIKANFINIRTNCALILKAHKRLANIAAFFITTRLVFSEYVKYILGEKSIEFDFLENKADYYVLEAVKLHAINTLNTTPEKLFIEGLNELILSHEVKIYKIGDVVPNNIKFHGYEDTEKYYLIPETVKECVYNFWEKKGKGISYTKNALYKKLSELGLLETSLEKNGIRNTVIYRFNGKTSRYLVVKKDVFSRLLEEI